MSQASLEKVEMWFEVFKKELDRKFDTEDSEFGYSRGYVAKCNIEWLIGQAKKNEQEGV